MIIFEDQISDKNAIFILAPRQMSSRRFTQIVKRYLPKANIIVGISKEKYVIGFEDQPQFEMLDLNDIQPIVDTVENSNSKHKVFIFKYSQSQSSEIFQNNDIQRVLLVNGSWKYTFHNSEVYSVLIDRSIDFKFISPFADIDEAHAYEETHTPQITPPSASQYLNATEMMDVAMRAATQSYDYSFQTGVSLGIRSDDGFLFIASAFNKVVPYQTYALHHGNSREKHLSRVHDTNHYDTIHAEMQLLVKANEEKIDLSSTTLFVNLLPCPNCARVLSQTSIAEIVYVHDHSDGYAVELLQQSGKTITKI